MRSETRHEGRPRGFTLFEVLVSLAILTISMVAVFQSFGASLNVNLATRDLWRAMRYAENELTGFERGPTPDVSVAQGEFGPDHEMAGFRWEREVLLDEPLPGIQVKKIVLTLRWQAGPNEKWYKAETYVSL